MEKFNQEGMSFYAMDFAAFGESESTVKGVRGYVPDFRKCRDDAVQFYEEVRKLVGEDMPIFLFAQSMGGLFAT